MQICDDEPKAFEQKQAHRQQTKTYTEKIKRNKL